MINLPRRGAFSPGVWASLFKNIFYRETVPLSLLLRGNILVDDKNNFGLLWTAKSGSTFATKWFFEQKGLLAEALNYHRFIHNYRIDIYRYSDDHRKSLYSFLRNPGEYQVIKITRHPLKRTVSSFIHTNKFNYADKQISKFLSRQITREHRFTFREFVRYLGSVNIYKCNVHYRSQVDALELSEKITVDCVIDLENSIAQLARVEEELGLKKTDLRHISESEHHTTRFSIEGFFGDTIDFFGKRGTVIPKPKNFFDDDLVDWVGLIYQEDFKRYNYNCSLTELD